MTGANTGMAPRALSRIRLGCAAASAAVFTLAVVVIGSLTPGYDQRSDAVSRLASPGEPWALAARAAFAAYGLLVAVGASTLRQYASHQGHQLARCLTLYGVACVVAGVAPKDQPGTAHTVVSQVHVAAAVLAGALAIGAMMLVSRCSQARATRRAAAATALLTGLAAGILKYTWGTQVYGISERVLLGLGMCWISALAGRALIACPGSRAISVAVLSGEPQHAAVDDHGAVLGRGLEPRRALAVQPDRDDQRRAGVDGVGEPPGHR